MAGELLAEGVGLVDESVEFAIFGEAHRVINDPLAAAVPFLGESVDFEVLEVYYVGMAQLGEYADFIDEGIQ
jgi:hypothetical protein